jgi:hypothetical protein
MYTPEELEIQRVIARLDELFGGICPWFLRFGLFSNTTKAFPFKMSDSKILIKKCSSNLGT